MRRLPVWRFAVLLVLLAVTGVGSSSVVAATQNAIQIENSKPGTPGWNDFYSVAAQDAISGFGSKISVNHGDSLDLYVTTTAPSFTIDVFRTGWYGGVGARLVASLGSFPGVHQAIPPPDPVTGKVSCENWTKTTTLNIPSDWVTGVYLAKLTASNGNQSFIFFVVRNDGGTEPIDFQTSVTTSQAYNAWGGVSLYTNNTNKSIYKYAAATKVSFDRPFDPQDSNGAGQFLAYEYPFIRWAESQGYDVTYTTDVDTHTNVNPLTNHRVFLSIGHDEYWSKGMRDNVTDAIAHGVNAAFFSANSAYWQIRFEPNTAGAPNRVEVGYKGSATDTAPPGPDPQWNVNNSIVTTRWRDAPVNLPENGLLGVMYQDQVNQSYAYVVQNASNWIYAGTGFTNGTSIPGIVGYEYDKVWSNGASPPGLTVLSNSPVVGCCEGSGNSFSNSTLYTAPSGAQVFASGTIQWSWGLDNYSATYANAGIQKTTANILNAFSNGPAAPVSFTPSTLDFGSQLVGIASTSKVATLHNSGSTTLTISSIGVTGANAADYSATNTCPLGPATLAAGATCDITVMFTPSAVGVRSASITVTDNAAGSPHIVALTGTGSLGPSPAATQMPLISRGVPAFASSALAPAGNANDGDYATYWTGSIPSWLAYDLSSVPAAQRGQVIVGWYNDPQTSPYDHALVGEPAYNSLRDYTIEANAAPGGTAAPTTGWVTLATVAGNHYNSRQHLVNLTGYNWVRINITAGDGSSGNTNASFNMDVHDASRGVGDSWIFYGDSITMDGMHHERVNGTTGNFSQLVNTATGTFYPAYQDGGIGGIGAADGASNINTWLAVFPGKYVALAFGTNDANGCGDTTAFYSRYVTMVQAVLNAGKIPIVPTIPWARTANIQSCGPGFVAKIQALYAAYPEIVPGPDLWNYFKSNQSLISSDDLHPSAAGYAAYRQQWVTTMTASVYAGAVAAPAVSLTPTSLAFGSVVVGSSSSSQSSTLKNTGTAPLTISSVGTAGANPGDFSVGSDCPLSPATLAVNATCSINVVFSPSALGGRAASVQLADNASGSPQSLPVSGTGVSSSPAVSLTPTSLSFGSQTVGSPTAAQSVTLRNTGGGALHISTIAVTGANASDFAATNTCPIAPSTLAPNATCTISAIFTPSAAGSRAANVQITDDAADSPQVVPLSGSGAAPAAVAFDKSLGTKTENVGGTTMTLTTNAAAVANARVVLFAVWNGSTQTLTSVSGGGLTWSVDAQTKDANDDHVAIASAAAPAGLASGVVLTATFSASVTHGLIAGASFTGLMSTGAVDATGSSTQAAVTTWSANLTATTANDLVVGFTVIDANATSTATAPNSEIHDFGDAAYYGWATSVYQIAPTAGTKTVAGTWSTASLAVGNGTVAVAYKAAAVATPLPAVSLTPTSLSFGSQLVGTPSGSQSSTVKNTGTAPLSISGVSVTGTNNGDFSQTTNCPIAPATLAANATCSVNVVFSPTASGSRSATVQIADNASDSPQSLGVSGTGTAPTPAVSLTPSSLAFGSQRVGITSAGQSSVLKNTGTGPLSISSVSVTGANPADFTAGSDCPLAPSTLAVNATCTITVSFKPTATGSRSASVQITDNAAGSPHAVGVSGTGVAPAVSLSPGSLIFGSQLISTTSDPQSSTLTNSGTSVLSITGIAKSGETQGDYTISSTCPLAPATLAVNASCTITATFSPSATGARNASVRLTDDALDSPQTLALSGTGATPAPAVSLSPASLSFGTQLVGTTSESQSSTLKNTGTAPLTVSGIATAGTNAADFAVSSDCPFAPSTLDVNATCTVTVTFSPSAAGTRNATVQVSDDAANSPQSLTLSGTGATPAPAVSLTPASLGYGNQLVGSTSGSQTSTLKNTGTAPLTIGGVGLAGANATDFTLTSDCPLAPATLAVNATCTLTVSFRPLGTGARSASVQIVDDAVGSPQSVALSGTGTAPAVSLTPVSLSFASQLVGSTSASQSTMLRNTGTAPLTITGVSVVGANPTDFTATSGCPVAPVTLAVNATCTISVTFKPGAAGARTASVQVSDNAAGSPQSVALSGTGSTSAVAFDKSLGTKSENLTGTTMTLTTSAAAAANARVFVIVEWYNSTRTLTSLSGGGLVWTVDYQTKGASPNHNHLAIASANAPAGLASGVVLTATFSGSVTHGLIAAASFTGIAATSPVDATASTNQAGVRAWSATITTINPTDLVLGVSTIDANTTSTATAPNTEIHDFGDVNYYGWVTTVYQLTSSAGAKTVNGTWAANTSATGNLTIAVAYKAG